VIGFPRSMPSLARGRMVALDGNSSRHIDVMWWGQQPLATTFAASGDLWPGVSGRGQTC